MVQGSGPHDEMPDATGDSMYCDCRNSLVHQMAPSVWHSFKWLAQNLCLTQLYLCAIVWIVMITLIRNVKQSCLYRLSSELLPHTR